MPSPLHAKLAPQTVDLVGDVAPEGAVPVDLSVLVRPLDGPRVLPIPLSLALPLRLVAARERAVAGRLAPRCEGLPAHGAPSHRDEADVAPRIPLGLRHHAPPPDGPGLPHEVPRADVHGAGQVEQDVDAAVAAVVDRVSQGRAAYPGLLRELIERHIVVD